MEPLGRIHPAWAAGFAFLATAVFTVLLAAVLRRAGWVDAPRLDRWHRAPVPRPGGPAIVAGAMLAVALFVPRPWALPYWGWLAGGLVAFGVGLLDDAVGLPNPLKLTLLIIAATVPLFFGVSFGMLPPVFGAPLALLFILALTNAVNWLDNMDGLAAGISAIAAATLAVLSWWSGDVVGARTAAVITGAAAGFLVFNFSPARIFMGDSGSGYLGLTLGVLAVLGSGQHVTNILLALLVPVMVLSIPIFDSAVVTLARLWHGRRLFQGGRDHPSHRLVVLGLSDRRAVALLYVLSALSAGAALLTSRLGVWTGVVLGGILSCAFLGTGVVLMRARVYQEASVTPGGARVVLAQMMHKRRVLEIIADLVLICVAYLAAYLLRFEGTIPPEFMLVIAQSLPLLVSVKIAVLYVSGAYRGDWRYAGLLDLAGIARAATLSSLALVAVLFLFTRLQGYSRAVFVIDWLLTMGLLSTMRVSVRLFLEYIASKRTGRRALIAGAGQGGLLLLQELRQNPTLTSVPVGFIDDDPVKQGAIIRGLPVLGRTRDIPALVEAHQIEEVLIAAPSMSSVDLDRVMLLCAEAGVSSRLMRPLLDPDVRPDQM